MATQTQAQRKSAAQKAVATRRRKAAQRSQSAQKAAETRARAELNTLQSLAIRGQEAGQKAVDVTVGAALEARDRVVGAVKPITDSRERTRLRRNVQRSFRTAQRRGATARKGLERTARGRARDAERHVKSTRRDAERQVRSARRETRRRARSTRRSAEQRVRTATRS
jgi:hypothetical protein